MGSKSQWYHRLSWDSDHCGFFVSQNCKIFLLWMKISVYSGSHWWSRHWKWYVWYRSLWINISYEGNKVWTLLDAWKTNILYCCIVKWRLRLKIKKLENKTKKNTKERLQISGRHRIWTVKEYTYVTFTVLVLGAIFVIFLFVSCSCF